MAVKTYSNKVNRALQFASLSSSMYICMGKTSPWVAGDYPINSVPTDIDGDTTAPPNDNPNNTEVIEPIGFKKVDSALVVIPYTTPGDPPPGTTVIDIKDTRWQVIDISQAESLVARYVLVSCRIYPEDFPDAAGEYFRQIGIYSGLVKNGGVPSEQVILLPSDVQNTGMLELVDNKSKRLLPTGDSWQDFMYVISY